MLHAPSLRIRLVIGLAFVLLFGAAGRTAVGAELPPFALTVYAPPSYSSWMPAVIKAKGFDTLHGINLKVTHKVGNIAYLDLALGNDYACGCVASVSYGQFVTLGNQVTSLFSIWLYTNLVAVADPSIRTAADLAGHTLGAAVDSTQWALSSFLLKQSGLDVSKATLRPAYGTAQIAEFAAGRVDAFFPTLTEVASLQTRTKQYHILSAFDQAAWQSFAHSPSIPYITLGVHRAWIKDPAHQDLARRLFAAYRDAADFARRNPDEAAEIINKATNMDRAAVQFVLARYPDALHIEPMTTYRGAVKALTQTVLGNTPQFGRPLTDAEADAFVTDFHP